MTKGIQSDQASHLIDLPASCAGGYHAPRKGASISGGDIMTWGRSLQKGRVVEVLPLCIRHEQAFGGLIFSIASWCSKIEFDAAAISAT